MPEKLQVPREMAEKAIQEKIAELKKQNTLLFSGITEKTIGNSKANFKNTSTIDVKLSELLLPLNKPFEFKGWTKLTYGVVGPNGENTGWYDDGVDYVVKGLVTLSCKDGFIAVSIENNTIEITNNKC